MLGTGDRLERKSLDVVSLGYCSRFVVLAGHPRRETDEFANLPPRRENRFKGQTLRLSS
jgi:hypothetical protein